MVGRALKELEAAGAIEMRRGQVVVLNLDRLRMLAHAL
jgi:DNA-binding transcriptional regulator YhcF (GntR family)